MHRIVLALSLAASFAARADVVDLTGGGRRRNGGQVSGLSLRAEFGNGYAPYGQVGAALSYLTPGGLAIEGGLGGGFPGVQIGFGLRQLFGARGTNVALELTFAGNTRQVKATGNTSGVNETSRYIWTSLGGGFEQRTGRFNASAIAAIAFTPADGNAHFGIHGGIGYVF